MPKFAHELEERFAEILDYFELEYEYEPTTFILKTTANGEIKQGFTPDFFIPEHNIYVEITAMNGSSCNKKRRKIEAIDELYGIKAILFHRKRIEDILTKFKNHALSKDQMVDILTA